MKVTLKNRSFDEIPIYKPEGPIFELLDKTIPKFPNEAITIYSLTEKKIIYAHGWKEVLGYEDWEMTLSYCISLTDPSQATHNLNFLEKCLQFLLQPKDRLAEYSISMEIAKIHKNGHKVPLTHSLGIYKAEENKVTEVVLRSQINYSIKFGQVIRYTVSGPNIDQFNDLIEDELADTPTLSEKEKQVLQLVANGLTYKEIAAELGVSISAIEKRILPLFKKFKVKSISHLIHFAHINYLID